MSNIDSQDGMENLLLKPGAKSPLQVLAPAAARKQSTSKGSAEKYTLPSKTHRLRNMSAGKLRGTVVATRER